MSCLGTYLSLRRKGKLSLYVSATWVTVETKGDCSIVSGLLSSIKNHSSHPLLSVHSSIISTLVLL